MLDNIWNGNVYICKIIFSYPMGFSYVDVMYNKRRLNHEQVKSTKKNKVNGELPQIFPSAYRGRKNLKRGTCISSLSILRRKPYLPQK